VEALGKRTRETKQGIRRRNCKVTPSRPRAGMGPFMVEEDRELEEEEEEWWWWEWEDGNKGWRVRKVAARGKSNVEAISMTEMQVRAVVMRARE